MVSFRFLFTMMQFEGVITTSYRNGNVMTGITCLTSPIYSETVRKLPLLNEYCRQYNVDDVLFPVELRLKQTCAYRCPVRGNNCRRKMKLAENEKIQSACFQY